MTENTGRQDAIKTLAEKIKDVRFAMMTTVEANGTLRSRPMATQDPEKTFDGDLWFFTGIDTPKVEELERNPHVGLSYAKPESDLYVSVSGTAQLVRDRAKMEEFYTPFVKAWFPDGLDDPNLALLKVTVTEAEYWDAPNSKMVQLVGLVKAVVTRTPYEGGENEKVTL